MSLAKTQQPKQAYETSLYGVYERDKTGNSRAISIPNLGGIQLYCVVYVGIKGKVAGGLKWDSVMAGSQKQNTWWWNDRQVIPWHPSWGYQRTGYMVDRQAFPWHPSRGYQRTGYMVDRQAFPWHPSRGYQRTGYMVDRQAFPWHPSIGRIPVFVLFHFPVLLSKQTKE